MQIDIVKKGPQTTMMSADLPRMAFSIVKARSPPITSVIVNKCREQTPAMNADLPKTEF